ncbi:MAG: TRAP transporter large permease subunit [Elusimicrobia bacterium]|nr:TRAP transporter large permease subunit [Elusimicrobiota bacterium]
MSWAIGSLTLALAALGTPIFALIGGLSLFLFYQAGISGTAVIVELARLSSLPSLIAIPLFTFAGFLLAESKAPQRMMRLAESLFGWMPAGVAIAALGACALFTAFTGASGVTIIALGGLVYPLLRRQGYPEGYSLGLVTTTGSLGLLFPPSLPIILYALVGKVPVDQLFAASAMPGLILLAALSVYSMLIARRHGVKRVPFSRAGLSSALRESAWELPLPLLVIGGIYGGFFTASEAAAFMCFYVLIVETLLYRDIDWRHIPEIMVKSMMLVGAILIVLGTALGLTNYLIDAEVPARLFETLQAHLTGKAQFLALLNVFLLVVNMVEIFSAIIIVVPLIVPVAAQYQIDPIHLGVLFLLNLEIGYMTAPMGLNLFLSSRRFNRPLSQLYGATLPFWLLLLAALALVTYIPELSLWLPKILRMR